MLRDLKMEVFYPYPPQQIWRVLTNRRALAAWLMENNFEPFIGHKFQFHNSALPGLAGSIDCEVIELDEPRRLSYTWQDSMMSQPSIVTWTLELVDGGTQLQLEHKGLRRAVGVGEPMRLSQPWRSEFMYKSTVVQTLPQINRTSLPVEKYQVFDSLILSSLFNGGWEYKLNEKLSQVLVNLPCT